VYGTSGVCRLTHLPLADRDGGRGFPNDACFVRLVRAHFEGRTDGDQFLILAGLEPWFRGCVDTDALERLQRAVEEILEGDAPAYALRKCRRGA
jgi:hypothetical protein